MKDRFFFPLILILAGAMTAAALAPSLGALPTGSVSGGGTDYTEIRVSGEELNRIVAGGESELELLGSGDAATLRIETQAGVLAEAPEQGPHFRLAADLENVFSGRELAVIMRVKPSSQYGAMKFKANYSTGKNGESDWIEFDLKPDFDDYTLTYNVPPRSLEQGVDFLAIRPVTPEKRRAIEIQSVIFRPGPEY